MSRGNFRPDIEGLRAIALLGVLIFHSGLPLHGGFAGVDVFFVLSGYLITSLMVRELEASGTISLIQFYARRGRRLLPAATLVLLSTLIASLFIAPEAMVPQFALDAAAAAAYFANWHYAARSIDYLSEDLGRSPLLHFWSLSVEEQFYFVWPALMILSTFVARTLRAPTKVVLITIALLTSAASFTASLVDPDPPSEAFFVTTNRVWELGIGALLALITIRIPRSLRLPTGLVGLSAIMASYLTASAKGWPAALTLLPTLGTALVILSGHQTDEESQTPIHRLLGAKPLVWLGGLSYSIYLWHWPVLVLGHDWLGLKGPAWGAALVALSFLPAWASYRWVEGPVRYSEALARSPLGTLSLSLNLSLATVALGLVASVSAAPDSGAAASAVFLGTRDGKVVVEPSKAGAMSLGRTPRRSKAGKAQARYSRFTPDPDIATLDVPRAYNEGCQVPTGSVKPVWCHIGAPNGKLVGLIAGDSKILQYYEAFDSVGKALDVSFHVATKSACAFAPVYGGGSKNHDDDECFLYTNAVLEEARELRPDFLLTSQRDPVARLHSEDKVQTEDAMVTGLRQIWGELTAQNTKVFVVLDNPAPDDPVYQCLIDNPDAAKRCAFDRETAVSESAAPVQRRAAKGMPGVFIIDPTDYICPHDHCAPVIGGVLIYRQGSHLTNTYARTLAPFFEHELREKLTLIRK